MENRLHLLMGAAAKPHCIEAQYRKENNDILLKNLSHKASKRLLYKIIMIAANIVAGLLCSKSYDKCFIGISLLHFLKIPWRQMLLLMLSPYFRSKTQGLERLTNRSMLSEYSRLVNTTFLYWGNWRSQISLTENN